MKSLLRVYNAPAVAVIVTVLLNACSNDSAQPLPPQITVYKSESFGCCEAWANYLSEEGFDVTAINHENMDAIKQQLGVPAPALSSCHTAVIDNYLVEGHVPASDILRLLKEKPTDIKGISAPGMPVTSPGMSSRIPKDYDVLAFTADGDIRLFSRY